MNYPDPVLILIIIRNFAEYYRNISGTISRLTSYVSIGKEIVESYEYPLNVLRVS